MSDSPLDDLADKNAPCRCKGGEHWSKYCSDHYDLAAIDEERRREERYEAQEREAKKLENRRTALLAAGMAWGGMSAVRDRNASITETADSLLDWLERPPAQTPNL